MHLRVCTVWGRSGVVVSILDFRSEGRWFNTQSLSSRCFCRHGILLHFVSLHPGLQMVTGNILLGVTLRRTTQHPIQGGVALLSVASCYRNQDKLRPCVSLLGSCATLPTCTVDTVNNQKKRIFTSSIRKKIFH